MRKLFFFVTFLIGFLTPLCTSASNPLPTPTDASAFVTGGVYSCASPSLSINSTTGEINLSISLPGTYTIKYEVNESALDCSCREKGSSTFVITIENCGLINPQPTVFPSVCDGPNNDDLGTFDLTLADVNALNGLSSVLYAVTYHASLADANAGIAAIATPNSFNANDGQIIYVRVQENANPAHFGTTSFSLAVTPNVIPTFDSIAPICSGGGLSALPTTSLNGITGTWSPALNNMATTTYTFIPHRGQCGTNTTMTIVVNPLPIVGVNSPVLCFGTSVLVEATPSLAGTYNYAWTVPLGAPNPGNVASFNTNVLGIYSVVVTEITTGCISTLTSGMVSSMSSTPPLFTPTKEGNIWYFGQYAGLDFNSGSPVALTDSAMITSEGSASISDADGQLLFYTDGITVWNKIHGIMPNGTGLMGHDSSAQSAVIVPKPGSSTIYYIFTVDAQGGSNGLRFSEVDMSLNSGLGDITATKNILLKTPVTEGLTFVKKPDCNYWVLAHGVNNNEFYAYEVNSLGVNPTPVISSTGAITHALPFGLGAVEQIKASPDGSRLLHTSASNDDNSLQLLDFNKITGLVSNSRLIPIGRCYSAAFSPSGNVGYVSNYGNLIQFDLNAPIISSTATIISSTGMNTGIQIGPDNKIYVVYIDSNFLGRINNPDVLGIGCNYVQDAVSLSGRTSIFGLPQTISSFTKVLPNTIFTYPTTICSSLYNLLPTPVNPTTFATGGTYSCINPNLVINASTGEINLSDSLPGTYVIKYSVFSGEINCYCSLQGSSQFVITIQNCNGFNIIPTEFLPICDDPSNDGLAIFDLTLADFNTLNGLNPALYTVTYHTSLADANAGTLPIATPSSYNATNAQVIYVRLQENANPSNFGTTSFMLTVNLNITPVFDDVEPVCYGGFIAPLPTVSTNGITGTWSPMLDNTATTTYTFTPNIGECAISTTTTIKVNEAILPTFITTHSICYGVDLSRSLVNFLFPTTSINGITGIWSPSFNNTATTTYTFTPDAGQCATSTTMTIVVNPYVMPTFNPIAPICIGDFLAPLPTTSLEGITGTWSPTLSITASGIYVFTPDIGQCAGQTKIEVTIEPYITPVFTPIAPICEGGGLFPLPTTSLNGVTGTWSPALNNMATTTYTFVPDLGQCANSTTMTVVVNSYINHPTFDSIAPICIGDFLAPLPTTSLEGITGTWSPTLSITASGIYVFTPDIGQCAGQTKIEVTIEPYITPVFTPIAPICEGGGVFPLPTTSLNGVTGTWSPALNNMATTTYTFVPDLGQCANSTTMTVVVNSYINHPTFDSIAPICIGDFLAPLPTTSLEGIIGAWSPTLSNTASGIYVFTPDIGQCAGQTKIEVTIEPCIGLIVRIKDDLLTASCSENIKSIAVYDAMGRLVKRYDAQNTTDFEAFCSLPKAVYIVKTILTNDMVFSTKILN